MNFKYILSILLLLNTNTNTPTRLPNTTLQETSSSDITTESYTIEQTDIMDNSTRTISRPLTHHHHNQHTA